MNAVPTQTAHVRFGPVSQVNIQASPLNAEAREDPAAIAQECQAIADEHRLPVAFSCELLRGGVSRHVFYPRVAPPARPRNTSISTRG